jgi:hypothetical protein
MRIAIPHVLAVMIITLAVARPALAAEADAAVVAGLLRFIDALEAGDANALEKSIAADTITQERSRKVFVELAAAQKGLERSALNKFGEEGKRFRCGFELIVNGADRRTITNARVYFEEPIRQARIEKPGELAPMVLRRNQDNQWQVILEHIEWEDEDYHYPPPPYPQPGMMRQQQLAAIRAQRSSATIEAFRQTQARIDSNELSTAAAAQAELTAKLVAAGTDAAKARAAMSSNRAMKERP